MIIHNNNDDYSGVIPENHWFEHIKNTLNVKKKYRNFRVNRVSKMLYLACSQFRFSPNLYIFMMTL